VITREVVHTRARAASGARLVRAGKEKGVY